MKNQLLTFPVPLPDFSLDFRTKDSSIRESLALLTSESGPWSTPGHWNDTNSWQRLCTAKLQTEIYKQRFIHLKLGIQ